MVGSVLMDRMQTEGDFSLIEPVFFSTSAAGGKAPAYAKNETTLNDAYDIEALKRCEIIITCQGGDYTSEVFPKLRAAGWNGHWIDAASTLRMRTTRSSCSIRSTFPSSRTRWPRVAATGSAAIAP
jgi:aspartate-semialdehyde dehydrogenase